MGFDLSGLSAFTIEDTRDPLVKAQFNFGPLQSEANVIPGVKSGIKIPNLTSTVIFQANTGCSPNYSGTSTITQKSFTMGDVSVEMSWCVKDLEAKFTQAWLKQGSNYTDADLPSFITNHVLDSIKDNLAKRDWFATTAADHYTGLGTNIETTGGYTTVTAQASVTTSNVISIIDSIYQALPARVLAQGNQGEKKIRLYMGWEDYRIAITAYKNANYFNNGDFNAASRSNEFYAPGTNLLVTADAGLNSEFNGTHRMYAIASDNIYLAVDGTSDDEVMDIWYDKTDNKVYSRCAFKRTLDVMFTDEVVRYANL